MKVLLTGATGFIGQHVFAALRARGHEVSLLLRDMEGQALQGEVILHDLATPGVPDLDGRGIMTVVHLAASLAGSPEAQQRVTVAGTTQLLEACQRARIGHVVALGSLAVLDYAGLTPMSLIDDATPLCPDPAQMGVYGACKLAQELVLQAFAQRSGQDCTVLRPGLVYDARRLSAAHAGLARKGVQIMVDHPGQVPLIHVEDVASALVQAVELRLPGYEAMNLLGPGLPGQQDYVAELAQRGLLARRVQHVSWQRACLLTDWGRRVLGWMPGAGPAPEFLRRQAFAARLMPWRYSGERAARQLHWQALHRFPMQARAA